MLHSSSIDIQRTLRKLLSSAQQYAADLCFEYPDNNNLWAHRAIVLARAPRAFISQHLPELLHATTDSNNKRTSSSDGRVIVYKDPVLPYRTLSQLLEFWYTAEFQPCNTEETTMSPIQSTVSLSSTQSSASSTTISTDNGDEILRGIREEEQLLGTPLLMMPSCDNSLVAVNSLDQLVADITRMYKHQLAADVTILLYAGVSSSFNNSSSRSSTISTCATTSFAVHRCILAAQSSYFHAMFCKEFCEASSPVVYLPSDVFTPDAFQVILDYYYTGRVQLAPRNDNDDDDEDDTNTQPSLQPTHDGHRLTQKILMMRVFQDAFRVAEYLGQYETVCQALMQAMADILKQYKCTCRDCAALLPSMLWFADRYVPDLRAHIISLYTDPAYALATLWPARTFGVLIESNPALATELVERMIGTNIKKQTAIQVLEALHLSLARVRNATVRDIVEKQLVNHTVQMISDNFEFYCVEYPILLSCVDGIAVGSVDFLEFLLMQVVRHGINERNAGGLYQGIVGDLIGRHQEMDVDSVVDNVLMDARQQCIDYIAKHWSSIKSQGGFRGVDKEMMRRLSEDLDVSYRTLTKHTLDAEIASLFSFKSRKRSFGDLRSRRNSTCSNASNGSSSGGYHSRRRLSLLSLRSRRSHESLAPVHRTISTPSPSKFPNLIPSRSLPTNSSSSSSRSTSTTSNANNNNHYQHGYQADKSPDMSQCSISSAALIDALLPIESASPSSANSRRSMSSNSIKNGPSQSTSNNGAGRPTRLRFELPKIPQRPIVAPNRLVLQKKSEKKKKKRSRSPLRYYRFGFGYDSSDEDEDLPQVPVLGARVRLLRRPLPMTGTIKFIGPVHFARGIYVGIELESRLGSHDGTLDGRRYFSTNQQRGTFCKLDDFKIISLPASAAASA